MIIQEEMLYNAVLFENFVGKGWLLLLADTG